MFLLKRFRKMIKPILNVILINDLKILSKKSMHKVVVGQININSIRNKFDHLMAAVAGNIGILLIA